MEERDFFEEKSEQRKHTLTCPHCGKAEEYEVAWLVRRKKTQLPGRADERDRARFAKAQSYMVRKDDVSAARTFAAASGSRYRACSPWRFSRPRDL